MSKRLKIFIIAGEPSGDALGADLISDLTELCDLRLSGIGGEKMKRAGLKSFFDMSELSLMGVFEIVPKARRLLSRIRETVDKILEERPDVVITIDSPDFCFRVLNRVKKHWPEMRVIHYVAPSVWAWRPKRAQKMAKYVDHVLALLPFEPPYMQKAGMSCDFVGHPIAYHLQPLAEMPHGSDKIVLLPGSRKGEISRMLPLWGDVLNDINSVFHPLRIIIPTVRHVEKQIKDMVAKWPFEIEFITQKNNYDWELQKADALSQASLALVTSGTVSLEVSRSGCPQIVAYRANWFTSFLVKRLAHVKSANLINLVADRSIVPEFLFEKAVAKHISSVAINLLNSPEEMSKQRSNAFLALEKLVPPSQKAAAISVLRFLSEE